MIARLITFFCLSLCICLAEETWETDVNKAIEKAKAEKKSVLVKFTGSDWCPPCIEINKAVFSKETFTEKASQKFVLCVIDSPEKDKELHKKNTPFFKKYRIVGLPTVLLLDAEGKEFCRYSPTEFDTVEKMTKQLDYQLRRKEMF